jgi:hypothetical protein
MKTSPNDFRQYCTGSSVSSFYNLGKDAILTIPCPKLRAVWPPLWFSRSSTLDLQTLLWRRVFSIAKDAGKPCIFPQMVEPYRRFTYVSRTIPNITNIHFDLLVRSCVLYFFVVRMGIIHHAHSFCQISQF